MQPLLYTILFILFTLISISVVAAIKFGRISLKSSYPFLFLGIALAIILLITTSPTLESLGLVLPSVSELILYAISLGMMLFFIYLINALFIKRKPIPLGKIYEGRSNYKIIFYIILSAPGQELLFRSFLKYSLDFMDVGNVLLMVVLSSVLFGIAHLVLNDRIFVVGTFIMGALWGLLYFLAPNLLLISIIHGVVGIFAFMQGLVKQNIMMKG